MFQTLPKALGPKGRRQLETLFDWVMPPCLRFIRKCVKEMSPTQDAALARSAMRIIGALLGAKPGGSSSGSAPGGAVEDERSGGGDLDATGDQDGGGFRGEGGAAGGAAAVVAGMDEVAKARLVEAALMFGTVWGVGGSADADGRQQFDEFFR